MQGGAASPKGTSVDVLRHPIRVRIVEACNVYGRLSPIEIVNKSLAADLDSVKSKSIRQQLSHVAYHCRELEKAGLLEVSERPVRGAVEHHYRPTGQAYFSDEEWAELTPHERRQISRVMWQHFIAQVENAMMEHTFDVRPDRWLAWRPLELDEQGWKDAAVAVAGCYAQIDQISRDAEERLKGSGEEPVRATWAVFSFESPTR